MNKRLVILILLLIAVFLSAKDFSIDKDLLETIEKNLMEENPVEREEPFLTRKFIPYENGEWIGQAVSYGCYREGQAPGFKGPSEKEILEDLQIISKYWNLIRVYNADDDTERILKVINENNLPLKVLLGVWLEREDTPEKKKANIDNSLRCLQLVQNFPEQIIAVNAGNETQVFWSWHKMDQSDLIRYIRVIRKYSNIPVTTADDYNFWNKETSNPVANEIDFIITHIYPLWNGKKLNNAISWLDSNYIALKHFHKDKDLVLGEIGWATRYNPDKIGPGEQGTLIKGEVSIEAQGKFLVELDNWTNARKAVTFLFEAFDEPWKGGGENTSEIEIEKNWGVFYENREPKKSFKYYLENKNKAY